MPRQRSLVLELQEAAMDSTHDLTDLLRKALVVATKLRLDDFKHWVNNELNGYEKSAIPEYRKLRAMMKVLNPYHGLQPFYMPQSIEDELCNVEYYGPISNIVSTLEYQKRNPSALPPTFPLTAGQNELLRNAMAVPMEPLRIVSETQGYMLLDAVRSTVLEWSLKLEDEGILGEGMTFSNDEKNKAAKSQEIHIGNFQGVFGYVHNSSVTQHLNMTVNPGDLSSLRNSLADVGVDDDAWRELEEALDADPRPTKKDKFGPQVSQWYGKMLGKAASGVWDIGLKGAGAALGDAISGYYGLGQ